LEVLCLWASLLANNFVQITLTSFHGGEEMVARFDFLLELLRGRLRDGVSLSL